MDARSRSGRGGKGDREGERELDANITSDVTSA